MKKTYERRSGKKINPAPRQLKTTGRNVDGQEKNIDNPAKNRENAALKVSAQN